MNGKQKNRGFTLVELIIAVAVLGIVISPLIANFIQSARLNKRSRTNLDATNMAQDIMEGASAYSAEEFIGMLQSDQPLTGKVLPVGIDYDTHGECDAGWNTALAGGASYFQYKVSDGSTSGTLQYAKAGTTDPDMNRDDYYFLIKGVKQGSNNEYDLRFHIKTDLPVNKNVTDVSKRKVAKIAKINGAFDPTVDVTKDEMNQVATEFQTKSSKTGKNTSDFIAEMERTITIDINDTDGTGTNNVVAIKRDYRINSAKKTDLGLTDSNLLIEKSTANISSLDGTQIPRSVYLYYEGMPGSTTTTRRDHIVVRNNTGKEILVYLIRMQSTGDRTSQASYNQNYGADVEVFSTGKDEHGNYVDNWNTKLVSNLRYDLSASVEDNVRVYKEDHTYLDGLNGKSTRYKMERCNYKYNGSTITEDHYVTNIYDGYESDIKNYVYNVTLEVWKCDNSSHAATTHVATFNGSLAY